MDSSRNSKIILMSLNQKSLEVLKCFPTDIGTRISLRENKILCEFGKMCSNHAVGEEEDDDPSPKEIVMGEHIATMTNQEWRDRKLIILVRNIAG